MKKILVAADMTTHPCIGGNNQCVMQYVKILRNLGYDVYYLLIGVRGLSEETIKATAEYWGDRFLYYPTPKYQDFFQRVVKRIKNNAYPDIIDFYSPKGIVRYVNDINKRLHFDGLIVNYIWQSKLAYCDIPAKAIYTHDVFTNRAERMAAGANWHSYPAETEAKYLRRFKNILAIQDVERDFFRYLSPKSNVVSVYSSFEYVEQPLAGNKNILFFSGGGDLNISGIKRFLEYVWPELRKRDKDITLLIGGGICGSLKESSMPEGVKLMGRYDDIADFYALGDIAINPVFEGTGLKIKTFEALAHGKTVIVDPHSAIGIYDRKNAPLLLANAPDDYVASIASRLNDKDLIIDDKFKAKQYIAKLNNYVASQYKNIFE